MTIGAGTARSIALLGIEPNTSAIAIATLGLLRDVQVITPSVPVPNYSFYQSPPNTGLATSGGGGSGGFLIAECTQWSDEYSFYEEYSTEYRTVCDTPSQPANDRPRWSPEDSCKKIVELVSASSQDSTVRAWAMRALRANRASKSSVSKQAEALFWAVRSQVEYVRDPIGSERISNPASIAFQLLRGTPHEGDCADHVGLLLSAAAAIGIRGAVVLQQSEGQDAHVVAALQLDGAWLIMDPSDDGLEFGQKRYAEHEAWFMIGDASSTSGQLQVRGVAGPVAGVALEPLYVPVWVQTLLRLLAIGGSLYALWWLYKVMFSEAKDAKG